MSQENVEILGAFYEAWNRGDIDDALTYVDPNVEVYPGVQAPDAKTQYLGREDFKDFFVTIAIGPWDAVTAEPKESIEIEDDRILSIDDWRFRGRDGIEIDRELPLCSAPEWNSMSGSIRPRRRETPSSSRS